jgi:hypothetical protein
MTNIKFKIRDVYLSVADVIEIRMNRDHDNKDGYNSMKQETS